MPDNNKKFHEFALKSSLFKGHSDYYFCYLKSEKIAHVLLMLKDKNSLSPAEEAHTLIELAAQLPQSIVHFAAGEIELPVILSDIFSLLSLVRLAVSQKLLPQEIAAIIGQEYEALAEKISAGTHVSPFVSREDFSVSPLPLEAPTPLGGQSLISSKPAQSSPATKAISKGHTAEPHERTARILALLRKHKRLSIKEISGVIKDCSEKTIQRELSSLISQGLVYKEGERRWSLYLPA